MVIRSTSPCVYSEGQDGKHSQVQLLGDEYIEMKASDMWEWDVTRYG